MPRSDKVVRIDKIVRIVNGEVYEGASGRQEAVLTYLYFQFPL